MKEDNKQNIQYFENSTMKGLFENMNEWQKKNRKRFMSVSIQQDNGKYCCISVTNPTEVIIVCGDESEWPSQAVVDDESCLRVAY